MEPDFEKTAVKVSMVSVAWNLVLAILKFLAGILANSGAMLSDAVHTASDVLSTLVVIVGVKVSSKDSDDEHPYGHERMECVAAVVLAAMLCATGLGIGYSVLSILFFTSKTSLAVPGVLALTAAILSIVVKEAMYWYTRKYGKKYDSSALMADAWHHRSDALSSVGALIGIIFARKGFVFMDPAASIIICLFIEKASYDIFRDAVNKMIDRSCGEETEADIRQCALAQDGVLGIDLIRTRVFGRVIYVDMEIIADGNRPLKETHAIAQNVHDSVELSFPKVKHVMVHVNPME